ncbi:iron-containing redox enzyme family protein [Aliidiomarina sp. Khilg15.8]
MSTVSVLRSVCDNDVHVNDPGNAYTLYKSLLQETTDTQQSKRGVEFLHAQLRAASDLSCDLPDDVSGLTAWVEQHCLQVGNGYADYLQQRAEGAPRQYFRTRSEALYYLQAIAPTKLVDGAWLYGLTRHWQDKRFFPLINTYLEELGDGDARLNHVTLYQELLEKHGCTTEPEHESLYNQGAIQLALAHNGSEFLPEIIGYNLGYEQPPLHMLITAYELKELGIDPYYFKLHVTTDNASTGHARQAAEAVQKLAPALGGEGAFYQRVKAGYMLNEVGPGAADIRASFDIHQQTLNMLEKKSFYGRNMHSDYCRIEGKTVNQWLQTPGQMESFLQALTKRGWVKHNDDPKQSRFWQLIEGEKAPMTGVFSAVEAQLIYDWIAGDWLDNGAPGHTKGRAKVCKLMQAPQVQPATTTEEHAGIGEGDLDYDLRLLQTEVKGLPLQDKMDRLIELMSPATHTSAAGLLATRMFSQIYRS